MRLGTDEDLAGFGALLKPSCDVHHGTDAHLLLGGLGGRQVDDRLAGLDAHTDREGMTVCGARHAPAAHRFRRSEGAQRVILVRDGRSEQGIDRVADVLLHRAAVGDDDPRDLAEGRPELPFQTLRAEPHRQLRRADDVDEHARDEAPLFADRCHGRKFTDQLIVTTGGVVLSDRSVKAHAAGHDAALLGAKSQL